MRLSRPSNLDPDLLEVFNQHYLDKLTASLIKLGVPKRNIPKWLDNQRRVGILLALADDEDIALVLQRLKTHTEAKYARPDQREALRQVGFNVNSDLVFPDTEEPVF